MDRKTKPRYHKTGEEAIFQELRNEANAIVERLEPKRRPEIVFKAFLFPILYLGTWAAAMIWGQSAWVHYLCFMSLGFLLVLIYLNIVHDAVHGTIFRSRKWNDAYVYLFDLVGANSFIWKMRHIRFHHNYPNVNGWDTDIEQSPLARVYPSGPFSKYHKYQHIYLPFLYPLFLLNWLLVRDFRDFFHEGKIVRKLVDIPKIEFVKLFFFKALFFCYLIVLPKYILGIGWGQAIGAFLAMVFTASFFALMVLLPPHANTENEFPLPDRDLRLPHNWFEHMLRTTNDVTHDNWFVRFFMGSFNFHVIHHLFPHINHVYYPEITERLVEFTRKHGLPYRRLPLLTALKNHYILLKQNRAPENIFEESM